MRWKKEGMKKMKTIKRLFTLLATLLLAACLPGAPADGTPTGVETPAPHAPATPAEAPTDVLSTPYETSIEPPAAVAAARQVLAERLGVAVEAIQIRQIDEEQFSNACLGAAGPEEMCAEVITPGYRAVFAVDGETYVYHTNLDGSQIRAVDAPLPPVTGQDELPLEEDVLLAWRREGGFAGFCDDLLIYADGRAIATSCRSTTIEQDRQGFRLSDQQFQQIQEWVERFESFELRQQDPPGAADAMTIQLALVGQGDAQATQAEQEAIALFAQKVYTGAPR
jgi:hypothetical protein